ncbi:MAG: MFS transporter [Vibrio sp.]
MNNYQKREVKWRNIIAWGSGDIFGSGSATIIGLWMLYFYTQVAGLSPVEAGSIFAIAKFWDAFTDPITAYITDNIRTRFGRRRVFFLFAGPFIMVFALLFISGFSFSYYLITYLTFNTVITLIMTPYTTLPNEMTEDYQLRTKMSSSRLIFGQITAFFVTFIPGLIMKHTATEAEAFMYIGIVFAVIFTIPWIWIYFNTWECDPSHLPPKREMSDMKSTFTHLYKEMASTFQLKAFRNLMCMYIGGTVGLDIFGSLFMHYMVFGINLTPTEGSSILSVMTAMQFIGVSIFTWVALKIGNSNAYKIAVSLLFVSLVYFGILPHLSADASKLIILGGITVGLARGGIYLIPWVVFNSIPDVDEVLSGKRRAGIFSGVMTLGRKVCQASAMLIASFGLQIVGFASGETVQTTGAVQGIYWIFLIAPAILAALALYGAITFKLTKENHATIVQEVERLKEGGSKVNVDAHTAEVVEDLTGWSYDSCWGEKKRTKAEKFTKVAVS